MTQNYYDCIMFTPSLIKVYITKKWKVCIKFTGKVYIKFTPLPVCFCLVYTKVKSISQHVNQV
jgi:hypothetical protein